MKKSKTFLVSGGAGFVGSHLTEALTKRGDRVVIVDDFSNGSRRNLRGIKGHITVIRLDITKDVDIVRRALRGYRFSGIFHLACFPRSLSVANPQRDAEVNGIGTLHMLQIAQQHKCKLVFTSNSGILGAPKYLPTDERHPDQPSTPYDANKLVGEYYCRIYNTLHGVPVGIVRLAAVYGDRQRTKPGWKPLLAEFVERLRKNEQPTIYWDGKQSRDFIYVKDVVQGLLKAMQRETGTDYYLLSTNTETSVNQLYRAVQEALGKTHIQPVRKPRVPGDIRRMRLSYSRARRVLGYKPRYSLKQGVAAYIRWALAEL